MVASAYGAVSPKAMRQRTLDPFILVRIQARQLIRLAAFAHSYSGERIIPSEVEGTMFYVYILRTSSNTLYIGQTSNLEKRLKEHRSKKSKSAKYTRYFYSFELVYQELLSTRSEAMKREWQLKQWSRVKKEALIKGKLKLLKSL